MYFSLFFNFVKKSGFLTVHALRIRFLLLLLLYAPAFLFSQVVYQDLGNTNIYEFLDELATLNIISIHSDIKPYSRVYIAGKLKEALSKQDHLNKRQKKELAFYLKDYNLELQHDLGYFKTGKGLFNKTDNFGIPLNPLAFLYKDSIFSFSIRPILGIKYIANSNGTAYHTWNGVEMFGTVGKHFGIYANIRDNHENQVMVTPGYFTQDEGAVWKRSGAGGDYSEMRGGVTFAWNWGSVALTKDHFEWGGNYHGSNILSGRTPSFPYFELRMAPVKWFNFNYVTCWINSLVTDSSQAYYFPGGIRNINFSKFLSAAMVTFTPWKQLDISAGSSVVSCSKYYNPAFLSPFLFFVNFNYSGDSIQKKYYGRNSQLFLSVSSRQIRHLHLYASLFIDDLSSGNNSAGYTGTSLSGKAGCRISDFPVQNFSFTGEYTRSTPNAYLCNVATLTYASNEYNLGHYLKDNSQELYLAVGFKPVRGLHISVDYVFAQHGDDQVNKTLGKILWENQALSAGINYEFINNAYVFVQYQYSKTTGDVAFTPPIFLGNTNSVVTGINIGF